MVRTLNSIVNLGEQSFGGEIGHGQRNGAGPDVINCNKFPVMFLKLPPFRSILLLVLLLFQSCFF